MTWKQALKKSIEKWDNICFEGGYDGGESDCACCIKVGGECYLCPIAQVAKDFVCDGTPYVQWRFLNHRDPCPTFIANTPERLDAAMQEYFFLCMLYHEYYG